MYWLSIFSLFTSLSGGRPKCYGARQHFIFCDCNTIKLSYLMQICLRTLLAISVGQLVACEHAVLLFLLQQPLLIFSLLPLHSVNYSYGLRLSLCCSCCCWQVRGVRVEKKYKI